MNNNIGKGMMLAVLVSSSSVAFSDTLREAVQHALISNPTVQFNVAKNLSSEQAMKRAKGSYYPSVDLSMGIGRENTENAITNSNSILSTDGTLTRREFGIEVSQNLFAGFGIVGEKQRLEHLWNAQQYKTLGVAEDLSLEVTEKYLDVLKKQQLVKLARSNIYEHQRIFSMIEQRSGAGISRQSEMEQVKGRLALARANYLSAKNDLRDARISYRAVVGDMANNLRWPKVPSTKHLPKRLANAIQLGLDNHPTLLSAHADIKEAKAQHLVAKANDYPRVDVILASHQNRNTNGLIGQNTNNYAMLRLKYNVFRGGSDLARKRETVYQVQEAFEVKNKTVREVKETIRHAWYAWLTAGQRLAYLKQYVYSTKQSQQAYAEQFQVGKRTLLDLLDSQNETYQAKVDKEKGHFDEVVARYRILNGMGMLLKYLNMRMPYAVHNDDAATSHENLHHANYHRPLTAVPKVDLSERTLPAKDIKDAKHPSIVKHKLAETTKPMTAVVAKTWFVQAGMFKEQAAAYSLSKKLKGYGMRAGVAKNEKVYQVYLGGFEYRTGAAEAMKNLYDRVKITGSIVHKRR